MCSAFRSIQTYILWISVCVFVIHTPASDACKVIIVVKTKRKTAVVEFQKKNEIETSVQVALFIKKKVAVEKNSITQRLFKFSFYSVWPTTLPNFGYTFINRTVSKQKHYKNDSDQ